MEELGIAMIARLLAKEINEKHAEKPHLLLTLHKLEQALFLEGGIHAKEALVLIEKLEELLLL